MYVHSFTTGLLSELVQNHRIRNQALVFGTQEGMLAHWHALIYTHMPNIPFHSPSESFCRTMSAWAGSPRSNAKTRLPAMKGRRKLFTSG